MAPRSGSLYGTGRTAKNPTGEIVIYDAKTLEEKNRIKGLTMRRPASSTSTTALTT